MPLLTQQDRVRMGGRRRRPEYEATVEAQSPYVPAVDAARQEDEYRTGLMALENERLGMERNNQAWREQTDAENRRLTDEAQEESMNLGYAGLGLQAGKLGYDMGAGGSIWNAITGPGAQSAEYALAENLGELGLESAGYGAATATGALEGGGLTAAALESMAAETGAVTGGTTAGAGLWGAAGAAFAPLAIAYGLLKAYDPTTKTSQSPIPAYGLALQQGITPDRSSDQAIQYEGYLQNLFRTPDPNYQPRDGEFEGAYPGTMVAPEGQELINQFMANPIAYLTEHGTTLDNPFLHGDTISNILNKHMNFNQQPENMYAMGGD
uniref:Uncharacterized protein n=1 Tax=viral metagenome TaxID=1070528 RepID=A0A6M3IEJ9_9ZZZZ